MTDSNPEAEIGRLQAELGKTADQLQWANDERGRLEADVDYWEGRAIKAEDEIERLREALKEIASTKWRADYCAELARLALERKT